MSLQHAQAELHTWNVVIRHMRYRDLARSIWGAPACRSAWRAMCNARFKAHVLSAVRVKSAAQLVVTRVARLAAQVSVSSQASPHALAAGLRGFHLVCCLQNFGAMLGSIPVVLSVAVAMKVRGVRGNLAAPPLC